MSNGYFSKLSALLMITTLISGCAGVVSSATKEENRDTTGTYDGKWIVDVQKAAGTQTYGKWNMNCGDMRRTFNLFVKEGTMIMGRGKNVKNIYIAPNGEFRSVVPIDNKASATGNSATTMSNGDMRIILRGKLADEDSVGYITYGIAELGYSGCTAKTLFSRS